MFFMKGTQQKMQIAYNTVLQSGDRKDYYALMRREGLKKGETSFVIVHNACDGKLLQRKKEFLSMDQAIGYFQRHYLNQDGQNSYGKAGYRPVDVWKALLLQRRLTNHYPQVLFLGKQGRTLQVTMLRYRCTSPGVGVYERMVNSPYGDEEYVAEVFDTAQEAAARMEEIKKTPEYQGAAAMDEFSFRSRSRKEAVSALCALQYQLDQGRTTLESHYMQWIKGSARKEDPELIGLSQAVDKLLERRHRWMDYYGISRREFTRLKQEYDQWQCE
jgi:hypothetical protein